MSKKLLREKLKEDYEYACNGYLLEFCIKHEFDFEEVPDCWVGCDVGTVAQVADYFVSMETMRTDIDDDAPKEQFMKWYDYCLRLSSLGVAGMPNFRNWLKGCPIRSEEDIAELERLQAKVMEAKQLLEDAIKEKSNF